MAAKHTVSVSTTTEGDGEREAAHLPWTREDFFKKQERDMKKLTEEKKVSRFLDEL